MGWTVVATSVRRSILPISTISPYSRSEKPPPLPRRAPFRFTATEPVSTRSSSGTSSRSITLPCLSAPLIVAASRISSSLSRLGSSSRKGCWSRSRGTAITRTLPSVRASLRTWVWGESGLALITSALSQPEWRGSLSAAPLAPAKLGIRPSAPGKRETPSLSMDRQTSFLTSSLERTWRHRIRLPTIAPMADRPRTSIGIRGQEEAELGSSNGAPLPAVRDAELRDHLPGVEPERQLNDWGRSERVEGFLDATLIEFFYRYWFRAEVEGIENVPATGGALIPSNHSGALPPDAAMIGKAIREEQPASRRLYITVEHFFKGYPLFSMLLPKIGCVAAHPANVHRLLADEEQLVLVFPEGRKGTEKLYKDRYKLRRCGRGGFVEAAMRARSPIVPVCVVGAEESAPIFAQVGLMKKLTGLLYFPVTPTFPWLGPLGMLGYLPAKSPIRFLEPIDTTELGPEPESDRALVQTISHEVRARIQENLHEMVGE